MQGAYKVNLCFGRGENLLVFVHWCVELNCSLAGAKDASKGSEALLLVAVHQWFVLFVHASEERIC